MGLLAYKLDILCDWKIHSVFSITQIKPAPPPADDPFSHPQPKNPPYVFVANDMNFFQSFKIDHLLNKRTIKKGKGQAIEYRVCWISYGPKYDRWYNIKDLNNAADIVCKYEECLF